MTKKPVNEIIEDIEEIIEDSTITGWRKGVFSDVSSVIHRHLNTPYMRGSFLTNVAGEHLSQIAKVAAPLFLQKESSTAIAQAMMNVAKVSMTTKYSTDKVDAVHFPNMLKKVLPMDCSRRWNQMRVISDEDNFFVIQVKNQKDEWLDSRRLDEGTEEMLGHLLVQMSNQFPEVKSFFTEVLEHDYETEYRIQLNDIIDQTDIDDWEQMCEWLKDAIKSVYPEVLK